MYFGVDYYPEHWVYPHAGTPEHPEARWQEDVSLMMEAGVNVVRMGEFAWGLYEPHEGQFDFAWMRRMMDLLGDAGIKVVLGTPTAAPPIWLARKYPQILPLDERGQLRYEGTRRAVCLNSDKFRELSVKVVEALARALGDHPQLIGWQIDNGLGGHGTEFTFNEETRADWIQWLRMKYETLDRLNEMHGNRFWAQMVHEWDHVPMPRRAPTVHNPALIMDWLRFSSDSIVAYARMQTELLKQITPHVPVTQNLRAMTRDFDHFDMAETLDFVSVDSDATMTTKSAENACYIDMMRSLKKQGIRAPGGGDSGFWVIEHKAGNVSWADVNTLVRPGVIRLFSHQWVSRGADGLLYFHWRQPRIGSEKFYGGVLTHDGRADGRVYQEFKQIGKEMEKLGPILAGTRVKSEVAILVSSENDWNMRHVPQPNRRFNQREHVQLFYNAFHDRSVPVDFVRATEDLSRYKAVIAPSIQLLAGGEADLLKLYVMHGGTVVATCNTGLVDEHHMAPDSGYPHDLTDLFGLEVVEFDPLPAGEENHLAVKGGFAATHLHPARIWCDIIKPISCQVLATFAKDFYAGSPALTINQYGEGRAIYIGTISQPSFYHDLVGFLRQQCGVHPLLKVPENIEVSAREKDGMRVYFLLNHQNSPVRLTFYKPVHDFLTNKTISGPYDLQPHGVLILDESIALSAAATP
ncbi:MAG: beta-galactosidase [Verrucomicrobia bacterium]|nr:beta-galactosidase [Verrucomicrobiota bacterium]